MLVYILSAIVLAALAYGIIKAATANPYEKMTDEEFEKRVRHTSLTGVAITELQKVLDPSHKVELVLEAKEEKKSGGAESGDPPDPGLASTSKSK